jgi:hypothetical protein
MYVYLNMFNLNAKRKAGQLVKCEKLFVINHSNELAWYAGVDGPVSEVSTRLMNFAVNRI